MLLSLILWLSAANADCMAGSLSVWPASGSTLPGAAEIVFDGYGTDRATLGAYAPGDLALVNGSERIALREVARHTGSFADDQLVVVPERAPARGEWTLEVRGEPLTLWTGSAHEAVHWSFGAVAPEPPSWAGTPKVVSKDRSLFGCGPAVTVVVSAPSRDAVWMEALVVGKEQRTTVRLPVRDGQVSLGHGMCGGLVELEMDGAYTVQLTPVGADGRRGEAAGPIEFAAP